MNSEPQELTKEEIRELYEYLSDDEFEELMK